MDWIEGQGGDTRARGVRKEAREEKGGLVEGSKARRGARREKEWVRNTGRGRKARLVEGVPRLAHR